jgi:hypothetical protein
MIETLTDLNNYLSSTTSDITFLKIFLTNSRTDNYIKPLIDTLNKTNRTYDFIETNSLELITFYTYLINDFPCLLSFHRLNYNINTYWIPCRLISLNSPFSDIRMFIKMSL